MIYIEGYALSCSLGKSAKRAVEQMQKEVAQPSILKDENRYYYIDANQEQDYYKSIIKIAQEALKEAKLSKEEIATMGLFIGTSSAKLPINERAIKEGRDTLHHLNLSELSSTLMQGLEMKGFNTIISTACTSSANAMVQAKEMLEANLINKALVLGVELYNELSIKGFNSFQLLSQDTIRPFDENRDGVILGEGVSALVLGKEPSPFEFTSGSTLVDISSITSPTATNLVKIMEETLAKGNVTVEDISVIKAHATGTLENDKAEAQALNELFPNHPCITALKPYIGHTMGACGTNEVILLIEALKQKFIPKTLNFETNSRAYPLTPLITNTPAIKGYYLLNYLGFGGNNCCLILKYRGL